MQNVLDGSPQEAADKLSEVVPAHASAKEDLKRNGRVCRNRPLRLSPKLLEARKRLGMSQTEMARALELKVHYSAVSNFELGTREPNLMLVLRYARLAGMDMEFLIDDQLSLPE